jgi:glycosyltransferase involved in cell wall biosynthesis
LLRWVRRCDHAAAQRVDRFVANSQHVARRIARHYGRDACVIYPPVDLPEAPSREPREDFLLCAGQHVPYKRLDLAVAACARLRRRLVVIGEGPDVRRLRGTCGDNVQWLGWQPRTAIETHYRRAQALLFPGEEDFGIVPVEAMAHGCPVVAYDCGGAAESVVDGETGVLFSEQTVDGLIAGIERLERSRFEAETMHARMRRFNRARFLEEMRVVLTAALAERSSADGSPGLKPARVRDP